MYLDILEKHEHWTPETLATMPWTQMHALFAPREDVFTSFAEARAALKARRKKEE